MKTTLRLLALCAFTALLVFSCQSRTSATTPKNVIIIIGDGTGFNQLQSASLYLYGEENQLTSQKFPVRLAATTYSADGDGYSPERAQTEFSYLLSKPTDSAASGTALSTGSKTHNGYIGVDTLKQPLVHLFAVAEAAGKATGVVTSVPFSHATPAAFVAHNASRHNYHQIAHEMIMESATDVIIGCGNPFYDDDSKKQAQPDYIYLSEEDWQAVQNGNAGADANDDGSADHWTLIESRKDFQSLASGDAPARLLGIPMAASTLQEERSGKEDQAAPFSPPLTENVPTLAELAKAAINVLDADPDGFYLMIEAGAIDWACHANNGPRLVEEAVDMEKMVAAVCKWVDSNSSWGETLVLITADHETGYLTGPGAVQNGSVKSAEAMYPPLQNKGKGVMPGMEFHTGHHSNSLVPVLAKGIAAEELTRLVRGKDPMRGAYIDNTDIAHYLKSLASSSK